MISVEFGGRYRTEALIISRPFRAQGESVAADIITKDDPLYAIGSTSHESVFTKKYLGHRSLAHPFFGASSIGDALYVIVNSSNRVVRRRILEYDESRSSVSSPSAAEVHHERVAHAAGHSVH